MLFLMVGVLQESDVIDFQVEGSIHIVHQVKAEEGHLGDVHRRLFILDSPFVTQVELAEGNLQREEYRKYQLCVLIAEDLEFR